MTFQEDRYRPLVDPSGPVDPVPARPGSRLSAAARQRESRAIRLALTLLGHDQADRFLRDDHPELGGRPLSIAADSPDGAAAVERLIMLARQGAGRFMPVDKRRP